jgi:hypothetical protein
MYEGGNQMGVLFFQIAIDDRNPSILFNETYSEPGTWFTLDESSVEDIGDTTDIVV